MTVSITNVSLIVEAIQGIGKSERRRKITDAVIIYTTNIFLTVNQVSLTANPLL